MAYASHTCLLLIFVETKLQFYYAEINQHC